MTVKSRIEIALLLPALPDARDACVQRLSDLLKANDGIQAAHIPNMNGQASDQICIHYDPERLSIGEVRELARRAGAELEHRFTGESVPVDKHAVQQIVLSCDGSACGGQSLRFGDLQISTPSAVLSGVARAARGGVLIKGGGPLENLGTVASIAFDKTGTLTEGKPRLTGVITSDGGIEDELLRVAIAVERLSDHPLAAAMVVGGKERVKSGSVLQAYDVQSITGRGVKATVDGQLVYIGKENFFAEVEGGCSCRMRCVRLGSCCGAP